MKIWLRVLVLLFPFAAAAQPPAERAVAITFDDLPFAAVPAEDSAQLRTMTTQLLHHLQTDQIPAVGFVNEAKLARDGILDAERVDLLRSWIRAGFELGNHTYSHPSLNRVPLDAFEADVLRAKPSPAPSCKAKAGPCAGFATPTCIWAGRPACAPHSRVFWPRTAKRLHR